MSTRSRGVSAAVGRQLFEEARGRCCVCGQIITIPEGGTDLQEEILQRHHIVYFSEGGENTGDNLVLVDPNCHVRIHRRPDIFSLEKVKEAKAHWSRMRRLVDREVFYQRYDDEPLVGGPSVSVPFEITSFGLKYSVHSPSNLTVRTLARFIDASILQPLLAFARLAPFRLMLGEATISRGALARKSDLDHRLDSSAIVGELDLGPEDALVALVRLDAVAAPNTPEEVVIGTIVLEWSSGPRDLDLHFLVDTGGVWRGISFRDRGSLSHPPFAQLDRDVTTGFGPETIRFGLLSRARYRVLVHNYSGESALGRSGARVRATLGAEFQELTCRSESMGRWWHAFDIDSEQMTVVPVNVVQDAPAHWTNQKPGELWFWGR